MVRFHFNGEFVTSGREKKYCGGREALSYIDRDKISLPEIFGHLRDHCKVMEGTMLHWLFPGKDLNSGLRALLDDTVCKLMEDCIDDLGVAEVYAEEPTIVDLCYSSDDDSSYEADESEDDSEEMEVAEGGMEGTEDAVALEGGEIRTKTNEVRKGKAISSEIPENRLVVYNCDNDPLASQAPSESESNSEYIPGDDAGSDDDEEIIEIEKHYKDMKRKVKAGQLDNLDDVYLGGQGWQNMNNEAGGEGDGIAAESLEDESMEEIGTDGEVSTKENKFPRYKKKVGTPCFELGMKFSSKKQFKKAVTKYALAERKVINFIKDDLKRVRAKCDWASCPWVCLLSKNTRSDSWQIVTLESLHACPPRRDNKMVTATRIAEKYGKIILANPGWNLAHMKATVQEEMFGEASVPKLKRAKAMVMKKAMDATKGQYQKLYNYQLELLRSNPGSTVVVNREIGTDPPVFKRIYICLDACKRGFVDGCRKVVGLDGCFFKGATNGELLCAIGRDANNQMYPIAWAVVHKENNEEWDWFLDLLCSDLKVLDGTGWVFISDQQKVHYYCVNINFQMLHVCEMITKCNFVYNAGNHQCS